MSDTFRRDVDDPPPAGVEATRLDQRTFIAPQQPVRWRFVVLYALAYIGTILLFLAPLLVSLSLKVNALVGTDRAPNACRWSRAPARSWPSSPTRSSAR